MATLNRIFFRGFVSIIPITLTLYILYWIVSFMENMLGALLKVIVPEGVYIPGLGVIATILLIFVFGLILNNFVLQNIVHRIEERLKSIPFIKAIYSPLRDLMNLFSKAGGKQMKSVVLVHLGNNIKALGVVTRENFDDLPKDLQKPNHVAVYIPWSYGMGGFTMLVPKSSVEEVDVKIEKAMSLAITGWVRAEKKREP